MLLGSTRTKLRVAGACVVILTAGAFVAPQRPQGPLASPQEHAAPLLEQQVAAPALNPLTVLQETATSLRPFSVAILPAARSAPATISDFADGSPAAAPDRGFGVFVSEGQVLTHAAALGGRSSTQIQHGDTIITDAELIAYEPGTGLVLLEIRAGGGAVPHLASAAPRAGALVVGLGRSAGMHLAAPMFVGAVAGDRFTIAGHARLPAGMPIFTARGELFALAGGDGTSAFAVGEASARLRARAASGERRGSAGLSFQSLGPLAALLGDRGVLISQVIDGGPASDAGIAPGDVLLSIAGNTVDSPDAAALAVRSSAPGASLLFELASGRRTRRVTVTPVTVYEMAARAAAAAPPADPPEARVVLTAAQIAETGASPTARVIAIDGRQVTTRTQLQRLVRAARRPLLVLLREGDDQFFASLRPPA